MKGKNKMIAILVATICILKFVAIFYFVFQFQKKQMEKLYNYDNIFESGEYIFDDNDYYYEEEEEEEEFEDIVEDNVIIEVK